VGAIGVSWMLETIARHRASMALHARISAFYGERVWRAPHLNWHAADLRLRAAQTAFGLRRGRWS